MKTIIKLVGLAILLITSGCYVVPAHYHEPHGGYYAPVYGEYPRYEYHHDDDDHEHHDWH